MGEKEKANTEENPSVLKPEQPNTQWKIGIRDDPIVSSSKSEEDDKCEQGTQCRQQSECYPQRFCSREGRDTSDKDKPRH